MKIKSAYIAVIILLFYIFSYFLLFTRTENVIQERFYQTRSAPDTRIAIIGIDDESLQKLGRWQDWTRRYYADLIDILSKGKPAVIGLDLIFADKGGNVEDDAALVEAVGNAKNVVLAEYGVFDNRAHDMERKVLDLVEPFKELKEAAIAGHINMTPDIDDGVVRTFLSSFDYYGRNIKSFSWQIYDQYMKQSGQYEKRLKEIRKEPSEGSTYVDFTERAGEYEMVSFHKVLSGEIPADYFEGRIVLIGPYAVGVTDDRYLTPLDRQVPMYGVEIHANFIQAFLYDKFKMRVLDWINILILVLFAAMGLFIFRWLNPIKSATVLTGISIVYLIAAKILYGKGFVISLLYPIALLITMYVAMIAYHYVQEFLERKRITGIFGKYVAPQVVKEILKGGEESLKLGGTRKEITALFVDIRGFTPLSEKVQPEEVVGILNEYLNLCAESIFKYEGTLDKFIGDAAMAIFNAPLDLEGHAFKAVQAAWAMKEGSEILQAKLQEKFGRSVQFGIGINTGYAVVGNIGSKSRMDYTAIGDTVNTAARLESNAKPGQILLSQATYELIKDMVQVESLGEIKVKGKEQGVPVYQLNGITANESL